VRRTKIVCTLGPATSTEEGILALVEAGMDVARLNLSHGSYADHEQVYKWVRSAADSAKRGVGVLVDLQGPKIRLGRLASGPVMLETGAEFTITTADVPGDATEVSTTYSGLAGDVREGDRLLIDDGRVALRCLRVEGPRVLTTVVEGGRISNNKGINLPGVIVSVPAMSEKDIADLRWGLNLRADMMALSFVRHAADVDQVRAIMVEEDAWLPVIAKIEKPEAIENLEEIVEAFDGIMVARGDLGVELPLEDVPLVQARAIALARKMAKPAIVATQMLESMISASRPTRAEASDVAGAVLDGADALMLSGETSVGTYPFESVRTMARIAAKVDDNALDMIPPLRGTPRTKSGAITRAAADVGAILGARYLVAFTQSGDSARRLSRLRSPIPLLAFTPEPAVRSQLALTWGVETFLTPMVTHTDEMVHQVDRLLIQLGRAQRGDLVVIVAGSPPGIQGSTNALRVHRIGDTISSSLPGYDTVE
jgi:pyruvate kinase